MKNSTIIFLNKSETLYKNSPNACGNSAKRAHNNKELITSICPPGAGKVSSVQSPHKSTLTSFVMAGFYKTRTLLLPDSAQRATSPPIKHFQVFLHLN